MPGGFGMGLGMMGKPGYSGGEAPKDQYGNPMVLNPITSQWTSTTDPLKMQGQSDQAAAEKDQQARNSVLSGLEQNIKNLQDNYRRWYPDSINAPTDFYKPGQGYQGGATYKGQTYQGGPTYKGQTYQAKDFSGELQEYAPIRQRAIQQANNDLQSNQDAIDRRFASMGMGNSGAAIKQQELLQNQSDQSKQNALNEIGFQEAQTRRGLQQQEANKEFQSQEAEQQREYGSQEQEKQRLFSSGEAEQQREFGSQEQEKQRAFSAGESERQRQYAAQEEAAKMGLSAQEFNQQMDFQSNQANFQNQLGLFDENSRIAAMDLANSQFSEEQRNNLYNEMLNKYAQEHSGGLFGGGGFLGLGL